MTTRMIERWFPCAEVSKCSAGRGWGSGFAEKSLFTWFASRPLAQAKAAVICSMLPWPDDEREQQRLKDLVRGAMKGYDANNRELRDELARHYPSGAKMCDPFSGRAMIPLEAARLGIQAWGIDYSPVATVAGKLLADYPLRAWDNEPDLPFDGYQNHKTEHFTEPRLLRDVSFVLDYVGDLYTSAMAEFYPIVGGKRPWGYVWAITLPCTNCGNRFPLTGRLALRNPKAKKSPRADDTGQSYQIIADPTLGTFHTAVHDGRPERHHLRVSDQPTRQTPRQRALERGMALQEAAVAVVAHHPAPRPHQHGAPSRHLQVADLLVAAVMHPAALEPAEVSPLL